MINFLRLFHSHNFEFVSGSMKRNGYQDINWALLFQPEYDATERCSCGLERTVQFLSYADKAQAKPIDGLKIRSRND